ncbi:MAG: hypothetical protein AAFR63_01570 [Cyanobacteria bacterium J06631_6]
MNNKLEITTDNSKLNIRFEHSGLQGKFRGGTLKLIYILIGIHFFCYLLLYPLYEYPFLFSIFRFLFILVFTLWGISFIYLILYSCFGFTSISMDSDNFQIEKGIGKFIRQISGKTKNITKVEIKPVEVFGGQYKNHLFSCSSQENASYAGYLLSDPEYCLGAMCDRGTLEQIVLQINHYLEN